MSEPVVVEVAIEVPLERVWGALRDPIELGRWHGWEYDGIAAEIRQIYLDGATISEQELTLDTNGAGRFELVPGGGDVTILRIVRAAPEGASGWDGIYDEINEGWLSFVQQLRFYLERHPGEDRRSRLVEHEIAPSEGEPWFAASHQRGVVVDERTLVIAARDKAIVSAYGLDDDAFAALLARLG